MEYEINGEKYSADFIKDGYEIKIDELGCEINCKSYLSIGFDEQHDKIGISQEQWDELFDKVQKDGEVVFDIQEIISIHLYQDKFYMLFWDTECDHYFLLE
jgi:hypothetical protein